MKFFRKKLNLLLFAVIIMLFLSIGYNSNSIYARDVATVAVFALYASENLCAETAQSYSDEDEESVNTRTAPLYFDLSQNEWNWDGNKHKPMRDTVIVPAPVNLDSIYKKMKPGEMTFYVPNIPAWERYRDAVTRQNNENQRSYEGYQRSLETAKEINKTIYDQWNGMRDIYDTGIVPHKTYNPKTGSIDTPAPMSPPPQKPNYETPEYKKVEPPKDLYIEVKLKK